MNKRNIGLDLLRLLAMFMIVLLHINNWGGLLKNTFFQIDFLPVYVFEAFSIVAVNCFILISGFFLIKQEFRLKKIVALIFEICFYTWLCFVVALVIKTPMDIKLFIKGLFTITTGVHWFITCYVMLYILFPFINKFIYSLSLKQKHFLAVITILLFSVWTFVSNINKQSVFSGYSILWVSVLYYWGAYIRLAFVEGEGNKLFNKITKFSGYGYIISSLITVFIMCMLNLIGKKVFTALHYNGLFVFIASICLFVFMYGIKFKNDIISKLIIFFAPASFGVFLLSDNIFVIYYQEKFLNKEFFLQSFNMPIMVLICALSMFLLCLCVSTLLHKRLFAFSDKYIYPFLEQKFVKLKNIF